MAHGLRNRPQNVLSLRTFKNHLAGEVAVKIYAFMLQEKWLESDGTALTPEGKSHFQNMKTVLWRKETQLAVSFLQESIFWPPLLSREFSADNFRACT
jgi:hypothetical protein